MKRIILVCALGLFCLLGVVSCASFEKRAEEKKEIYDALDDATKARLKEGSIRPGDTMDMVYIALGYPDEETQRIVSGSDKATWVYNSYYQVFAGYSYTRYYRHVVYNPRTRTYRVHYIPVREPVYETRVEERIRVNFVNGEVSSLEQVKAE